jgi:hypothetical protein
VATIQIWTFSTVCLSPRLPENPDWKEGKRSICKSMGGCMQRYRQTRTLWKKRLGMEYRVTLSIHPSQFQFHQFKRVYPSSCKTGSFASSLPQASFAVFKFRNNPNWRPFILCVPLCLFLSQELKRWLNELCTYRNAWDEPDMAMKLATNGRQPGRLSRNGNSRMR